MSVKIYIPGDSGAVALGADRLAMRMAEALKARDLDAEIVRNGSRGLYWLEPMIEVETGKGRVAYGPVKVSDVDSLIDAGLLHGGDHPLSLGAPEELPFLKRQTRLTFARCGLTDPLSLEDYRDHGGLTGLTNAIAMAPEAIVAQVTESGLRGRGGAGEQPPLEQAGVRPLAVLGHPTLVGEHHVHLVPVEPDRRERVEDRPRRGAAGHREAGTSIGGDRRAQLARQPVGEVDHHHLGIGVFDEFHRGFLSVSRGLSP